MKKTGRVIGLVLAVAIAHGTICRPCDGVALHQLLRTARCILWSPNRGMWASGTGYLCSRTTGCMLAGSSGSMSTTSAPPHNQAMGLLVEHNGKLHVREVMPCLPCEDSATSNRYAFDLRLMSVPNSVLCS